MALRATDVRGADYEVLLYALIGASAEAEALREAVKEWIKARDAYMGDTLEEEGDLFGTMIQSFYKVREMVGLRGAPASNEPTTDPIDLNTEG